MRHALLGVMMGVAIAGALMWSCTGNNKTDGLACANSSTCGAGRVCNMGYCIVGTFRDAGPDAPIDAAICPDVCPGTACNFQTRTCNITGTGSGNITCPTGWNCVIGCASNGACEDIHCTSSLSCTVTCGTQGACNNITCSTGTCDITCDGNDTTEACGNITCTGGKCGVNCLGSASCGGIALGAGGGSAICSGGSACLDITCGAGPCDVQCNSGSAACGTITTAGGAATVNCMGSNACGNILSGSGALDATCTSGSAACGTVDCAASCRCDVSCPAGDCGTNTCPVAGGGPCINGTTNECDSAVKPACKKC